MSGLRILGRPGQKHVLAACRASPHPAYVDAQSTQKKLRMEALGAEIARLRVAAGMRAQADLAKASGVSVRTISLIETGKQLPRVGTMRKIEQGLDLPPGATDEFMDGQTARLAPVKPQTADASAGALADLTPLERELVLASSEEIERRVTNMIEDGVEGIGEWVKVVTDLRDRYRPRPKGTEGDDVADTTSSA